MIIYPKPSSWDARGTTYTGPITEKEKEKEKEYEFITKDEFSS